MHPLRFIDTGDNEILMISGFGHDRQKGDELRHPVRGRPLDDGPQPFGTGNPDNFFKQGLTPQGDLGPGQFPYPTGKTIPSGLVRQVLTAGNKAG